MKLPEFIKASVAAVAITTAATPAANAQSWKTEVHSRKTSEFAVPTLSTNELARDFKNLLDNPSLYKSKVVFEETFPNEMIPYGYKDLCGRLNSYLDQICRVIEKPKSDNLLLHESTYSVLEAVNRFVNKNKSPISDKELFGVTEYWDHLVYRNAGDCEDIARFKNTLLIYKHFPPETLNIALVEHFRADGQVEGHLVLLVTLEHEGKKVTFVLDNLREKPILMADASHLRFVAALSPDRRTWKKISVGVN